MENDARQAVPNEEHLLGQRTLGSAVAPWPEAQFRLIQNRLHPASARDELQKMLERRETRDLLEARAYFIWNIWQHIKNS